MKKINILLKLSFKFTIKYLAQYFSLLLLPLGALALGICLIWGSAIYLWLALLSIPCFCYAFWKGYFITYCLNGAAYDFIKSNTGLKLKEIYNKERKNEKNFALYISFCAVLSIILYTPSIYNIYSSILKGDILENPFAIIAIIYQSLGWIIINTIFLFPFLNFITQAYFFRKEKENFLKLFLNCYTKLDFIGILISLVIGALGLVLNFFIIIYLLLFLFINPFIYALNTFWYSTRVEDLRLEEK